MKHLCWIGNPYFCQGLEDHGWTVTLMERRAPCFVTWNDVKQACKVPPDAVVLGDASLPPILANIESWPCLTAFHCVDSHIHSWHPIYAQAFDLVSVSLRDHLPLFQNHRLPGSQISWVPPWAPDHFGPANVHKKWDVLFAGTVNPETTPRRYAFLNELGRRLDGLHVTCGDFGELFPQARIVLNYCEHGDLNFRVFEALGCGSCLLTPEVGHGQDELFAPDEALFTYPVDDMDALQTSIESLLAAPTRCAQVAETGLGLVDAGHRAKHRARDYSNRLRQADATALRANRQAALPALKDTLRLLYLHFAETTLAPELKAGYLRLAASK